MFGLVCTGSMDQPVIGHPVAPDNIHAMREKVDHIVEEVDQIHHNMIAPAGVAYQVIPRHAPVRVGPAFFIMLVILIAIVEPLFVWTVRHGASRSIIGLLVLAFFATWVRLPMLSTWRRKPLSCRTENQCQTIVWTNQAEMDDR